jgi:hypothetical protein
MTPSRSFTRAAFTLVEALVASCVGLLVLSILYQLATQGHKMFARGLEVAYGRQASMLFFEQLEDDLNGCVVVPGHVKLPVSVTPDGRALAFFRCDRRLSTMQVTVGTPVDYRLTPNPRGPHHPVRNGVVLERVAVSSLRFTLVEPDSDKHITAWYVCVDAVFPESGWHARPVPVRRLIELTQPTTVQRMPEALLSDVPPLSFMMLPGRKEAMKLLAQGGLRAGVGPAPEASPSASAPASPVATAPAKTTPVTTATASTEDW